MTTHHYLYAFIGGLFLGGINSWYWYTKGYRGGKLFFLGTIGFFWNYHVNFKSYII